MIVNMSLVIKLFIFTLIIHFIDTLSYSVRLNSVKKGNFALSLSLFNLIVLISRTANTFQGPLIGSLIDSSVKASYNPIHEIRWVVFASTVGTSLAVLFIPTFLKMFSSAVSKLEETGSVPGLVTQSLSIANIKRIARKTTKPSKNMLKDLRFRNIPKRLLLINIVVTGVYTIGVLAANYAAIIVPDHMASVIASSGMINSIATILLTLFIDPRAAQITDEVYRGKREYGDIKALVIMLIGTKLLGTILGQVLLVPSARIIAYFYR